MTKTMIFAGSGGQGIQFCGKQMAKTAMHHDMNVTFLPSYGPEMRGGTSNSTVVISDEEIGSPSVANPDIAVVMNLPSFDKFEARVKAGGLVICDSTLIDKKSSRDDIDVVYIPASDMANENDLVGFANVIILGCLIKKTGIFTYDEFLEFLTKSIPETKSHLIEKNTKALSLGYSFEM